MRRVWLPAVFLTLGVIIVLVTVLVTPARADAPDPIFRSFTPLAGEPLPLVP